MSDSLVITETERLVIRKLNECDIHALSQILADPRVMHYSVRGVMTVEQTSEFVKQSTENYVARGFGAWALEHKQTSALLGFAGFGTDEIDGRERIELGYRLAPAYWGTGFATEAATGILEYGFAELNLSSICVIVLPEHVASWRVAEKTGYGSFRLIEHKNLTVRLYEMSRQKWKSLNPDGDA